MKTRHIALTISLLFSTAVYAEPAHITWAETLVTHISPDKNDYGSDPTYVYWSGVNGATGYENRSQCSSFVTHLLKQAYNWNNSDFSAWFGSTSPSAALYHDTIENQNGFTVISNVNDIQEGDILAVKYSDEDATATGHVMIADDIARTRTSSEPVIAGTTQYSLKIIDTSKTGHGSNDTRMMNDGTWDSGVGTGTLRLYADSTSKNIVGYSWSIAKSSVYYHLNSTRHLVIGRLAR